MKKKWTYLQTKKGRIIGSIVLSLFFLFLILFGYQFHIMEQKQIANKNLIAEIKSHYASWITVIEDTKIYCNNKKEYQVCGEIGATMTVELEESNITKTSQQYFKIKGTNLYLFYLNIKPSQTKQSEKSNYLIWNQNIKIKENSRLYHGENLAIQLPISLDLSVEYADSTSYYVKYLNYLLSIKKEEVELYEHKNSDEEEAEQIPVLSYQMIDFSHENFQKQIAVIKEQGYRMLSLTEYESWKNGWIKLPKNSILLLGNQEENKDIKIGLPQNTTISFLNNNRVSTKNEANSYSVSITTSISEMNKMLKGETIVVKKPIVPKGQVPVLNYHFFYVEGSGENCKENICLSTSKFEQQLKYLNENGYYTLTMEEFRSWMYGEREIPEKSVLLTVDDGAFGTGKHNGNHLIPLLEKYGAHATLFLITGWWDIENYRSPNLDIESHTNDMHTGGLCQNQMRGAQILCSNDETVMSDLKKSIDIIKSRKAFCFPFYAYNDTAVEQVKRSGFALSFVGGSRKVSRTSDKYRIPRYPIYQNISMEQFIGMIS